VIADIMESTEVPGLRFLAGPGPTLGDVENCLTAITATANVAACLAAPRSPGRLAGPPAREAIARLADALGTRLTWPPGDIQAAVTA
jgi:arginase